MEFGNFATLMQITLALQNPSVEECKEAWKCVASRELLFLEELIKITSPLRNFKELRVLMQPKDNRCCSSSGGRQSSGSSSSSSHQLPTIPFTGIYVSDMIFNAEKASVLEVNIQQQLALAGIIRKFQTMKDQNAPYNVPPIDRQLYSRLVLLPPLWK